MSLHIKKHPGVIGCQTSSKGTFIYKVYI